jgi:hypothetical protein
MQQVLKTQNSGMTCGSHFYLALSDPCMSTDTQFCHNCSENMRKHLTQCSRLGYQAKDSCTPSINSYEYR